MPTARRRVQIDQGADFARTWLWLTGTLGDVSPVPGLGGAAARLIVTSPVAPTAPVVSISTTPNGQGSIVLTPATGSISVAINKATTSGLAAGVYLYQLFIDWPGGTSTLFLEGAFIVSGS